MKNIIIIFSLVALASCSHQRTPASTPKDKSLARDSMALGNVRAQATKRVTNEEVCFEITVTGKNIKKDQVLPSNWTLAWVDNKNHYHLIPMTQRTPASQPVGGPVVSPYGFHHEYSNTFNSCAPRAQYGDVKGLVLTPKSLPYDIKDGLKLSWE
jgi:hypothetical protein